MKKQILIIVAFFTMAVSVSAQSNYEKRVDDNVNAYLERIEDNIKLTPDEKNKIYKLKKTHTEEYWKATEEFKEKPELAEEKEKVSKIFSQGIITTFGRKRGLEILKASRVKKD